MTFNAVILSLERELKCDGHSRNKAFQEFGFESMTVGCLFLLVVLMWFYVAFYRLWFFFFNCFHLLNKRTSSIFDDGQSTWSKWTYFFLSQADMVL